MIKLDVSVRKKGRGLYIKRNIGIFCIKIGPENPEILDIFKANLIHYDL